MSRVLLSELLEHCTRAPFVYRHRWKVGDLLIWDNRCIIHRGCRYDLKQRRELMRVTTEETEIPAEISGGAAGRADALSATAGRCAST